MLLLYENGESAEDLDATWRRRTWWTRPALPAGVHRPAAGPDDGVRRG